MKYFVADKPLFQATLFPEFLDNFVYEVDPVFIHIIPNNASTASHRRA
jgi:hypothetical protein